MILIFQHRQFFLFNDLLVYGNIVINKKKYNKQVGLFYIPNDVITTQFAAFNSLGRSEIKILGGWGTVQEWLAHLYKVQQEIGVGGSCKNLNLIGLLVKPHYVRGKSFAVFAATATEKQEWMAHINKCIEVPLSSPITHLVFLFYQKDLLRKSGKKAVDEHAAVWVPDSEAGTCMHCKKVVSEVTFHLN